MLMQFVGESGAQCASVLDALKTACGNRKKAAKLLDTTERIMGYKVKKYGIDAERFRR